MFGTHFYHERIRKAVAMFGTLFNDIYVVRKDGAGKTLNQQKVPLSYAPSDKYLIRIREQESLDNDMKVAIKLPRMSFELISLAYDPVRMLPKSGTITVAGDDNTKKRKIYNTVPYNIAFQLNIYSRAQDDALQVVEQILPYFSPQYTLSLKPLTDFPSLVEDVPIVLTGVSFTDEYEGALEERRIIIYTLDFEMKCNFHSRIDESSIIRKTISNLYEQGGTVTGDDRQATKITTIPDPASTSIDSDFGFTNIIENYNDVYPTYFDLTLSAGPAAAAAVINENRGISAINVTTSGAGFNLTASVGISLPADAINAQARAFLDSANFRVDRIEVTTQGTNYREVPTVTIFPPDIPALSTATATVTNNKISAIDIADSGTNFVNVTPGVTIGLPTQDSAAATGSLTIDGSGNITAIGITSGGTFYDSAPNATITYRLTTDSANQTNTATTTTTIVGGRVTAIAIPSITGAIDSASIVVDDPTGWKGLFRATAQATVDSATRRVSLITVIDSGDFYSTAPAVSVDGPPAGTQATAVATVNDFGVISIAMSQKGTNYNTPPSVAISSPAVPIPAEARLVLAADNSISNIVVTEPGTNYDSNTRVLITDPIPFENEQFIDSETVRFTLNNGVSITAAVKSWDDENNILRIDTLRTSDNAVYPIDLNIKISGDSSDTTLLITGVAQGPKGF